MVPMRAIFEELGATVEWDNDTRTVTAYTSLSTIKMTIGEYSYYIDGTSYSLDVPAQIVNNRTLVPVRAVSEAFLCKVGWDGQSRIVSIINDKNNYQMLYSYGGRQRAFHNNDVPGQLTVGWFDNEELKSDKDIYKVKVIDFFHKMNSVGGVEVSIGWRNQTNKDIKYIDFHVVPYNAVGDKVQCSIQKKSEMVLTATGPYKPFADKKLLYCYHICISDYFPHNIYPDPDNGYYYFYCGHRDWERGKTYYLGYESELPEIKYETTNELIVSGDWYVYDNWSCWDPVWYNYSIDKIKIEKIEIEYMDGTKETLELYWKSSNELEE